MAALPPKYSTAAIPSEGRKISPGRNRASTPAWRMVSERTASALPVKRSRTSSSRPKACTISIPTTASSVASVRCPFFAWTMREIGNTLCAKRYVRTAIGGIASAAIEREPCVHGDEDDRRADQHHHALDRLDDAPADEVADGVDVVRRPRDHLARRMPVVEGAREAKVGVVHHPAQPGLDGDADAGRRIAAGEVDAEADGRDERDQSEVRAGAGSGRRRRSRCRSSAGSGSGS